MAGDLPPLVVVLENRFTAIIDEAKKTAELCRVEYGIEKDISVVYAEPAEPIPGLACYEIPGIGRETLRRASIVRQVNKAEVGIGIARGFSSAPIAHTYKRLCFDTLLVGAVCADGLLNLEYAKNLCPAPHLGYVEEQAQLYRKSIWDKHIPNMDLVTLGLRLTAAIADCAFPTSYDPFEMSVH